MKITASKRIMADSAEDMRAKYRQRRVDAHNKKFAYIKEVVDKADDKLDALFEELVPGEGACDSLGGELVRAMMRLLYRDYNDGDKFFEGYGIEVCADAAAFLWEYGPDEVSKMIERMGERSERLSEDDEAYTAELEKISEALVKAILGNLDEYLKKEPNTYDYQEQDGEDFVRDNGYEPLFDTDITIPDELQAHLDAGNISERDLEWELESWDGFRDCTISVENGYLYLTDLPGEAYREVSQSGYKWLEQYARELTEEYGDPFEEDDEDEDEYDEDEE